MKKNINLTAWYGVAREVEELIWNKSKREGWTEYKTMGLERKEYDRMAHAVMNKISQKEYMRGVMTRWA